MVGGKVVIWLLMMCFGEELRRRVVIGNVSAVIGMASRKNCARGSHTQRQHAADNRFDRFHIISPVKIYSCAIRFDTCDALFGNHCHILRIAIYSRY